MKDTILNSAFDGWIFQMDFLHKPKHSPASATQPQLLDGQKPEEWNVKRVIDFFDDTVAKVGIENCAFGII